MRPRLARLAYALILAWLALFFAYPLLRTIQGGFQDEGGAFTLAFLIEVFRNPIYLEGLRNSFLLAVATTGLVALIAIPLALIQARYRFPGKGVFGALILVPMILPPFVGALGLRQFWGQAGVLNALLAKVGLSPDPPIDW
ncbi:MAG: iron ABC transporter permease, partial [Candidatus Omnitrophica bacterium]|nr:iron ABC transporter permease [Candidatus Omnitrophota bacterium]